MAFKRVCKDSEVVAGAVKTIATRYGRVGLIRLDGEVCAFQDVCTHDDGPLAEGELDGEEIVCPRHGARFNMRTGAATKMPATEDIEVYPVRLSGDEIEIDLD